MPVALNPISNGTPNAASSNPNTPPVTLNAIHSTSNCRTNRQRLAPSAVRTAISVCRPAARANRRLATFAHAITKTHPTAPNNTHKARRTRPVRCSCSETDPYTEV